MKETGQGSGVAERRVREERSREESDVRVPDVNQGSFMLARVPGYVYMAFFKSRSNCFLFLWRRRPLRVFSPICQPVSRSFKVHSVPRHAHCRTNGILTL